MLNIISRSIYQFNPTGPKKVVMNLIAGLEEAGIPYVLNKKPLSTDQTLIHDDLSALIYIQQKLKAGKVTANDFTKNKLVVGPNLAFDPAELERSVPGIMTRDDGILTYTTFLCPSSWVEAFWKKRGFDTPIAIWPVGVDTVTFDPEKLRVKLDLAKSDEQKNIQKDLEKDVLVYTKGRDQVDIDAVISKLIDQGITYTLLQYGSYTEKELIQAALTHTIGIVIVSSESQGLALEELMSLNLPLLVWNIKTVNQRSALGPSATIPESTDIAATTIAAATIAANITPTSDQSETKNIGGEEYATSVPYFSAQCGIVIERVDEVIPALQNMLHNIRQFSPRSYIENNLSLEKQAKALIDIFQGGSSANLDTVSLDTETEQRTKYYPNWKNRTWLLPFLYTKYILKYIRWKLK